MFYNVLDFHAVGDGATLNTKCIQTAIDRCAAAGGGTVVIPAGTFVTGTLFFRDNVELHLSHGAVLLGSTNLDDYNAEDAYPQNFRSNGEQWNGKHLICAVGCENVAITGFGVIDGNGAAFYDVPQPWGAYCWKYGLALARDRERLRPGQALCFIESRNICVTDITIRNVTCWACFMHGCENVQLRGIRVTNPNTAANTDGIDIDCCAYVTVSDCIIRTGDDAIAIRCDAKRLLTPRACEYVTISNCVLSSASSAFRIGVGVGQIRHVRVSGIVIAEASSAITFNTSFNGNGCAEIADVNFSNISAEHISYPLQIYANPGYVRGVTLDNIRMTAVAGATVLGHVSNLTMRNTEIHILREDVPLTEKRRGERGDIMLALYNTDHCTLDHVRLTYDDDSTWQQVFREADNRELRCISCNF